MSASAVLRPAGPEATALAEVIGVVLIVGAVCFLIAMAFLAAALWWRGRRALPDGWWLWGGGIALPVVVFGALYLYSEMRSEGLDDPPPPNALTVSVTGRLWWWSLRYEADGAQPAFVTANELRVPVGRPVRLTLGSADVIHSVWVPSLGGKMDLVPGRLNRLTFTADRPGVYRGPCAEYCGTQHAKMVLHVIAMPVADFERWRAAQAAPAAPLAGARARGAAVFNDRGCASCHSVRGVAATAKAELGPDLTRVADRMWLGAGTLRSRTATDALRQWITDVQSIKPGAQMPSYRHLSDQELSDLLVYLEDRR